MAELFSRMGDQRFDTVAIELTDIAMSRGETPLFSGLSTRITTGDILWVQGDNGIGKTTLLGALAGLHRVDTGTINWTSENTPCQASKIIAYQPHQSYAKPTLTVREDLKFWARLHGAHLSLEGVLSWVGLETKGTLRTGKLSAGQKKRLALAKLIISHKPIWLLDEPAAAMDEVGTALIDGLLEAHIARGGAAIIASHEAARSISSSTRLLTLRAVS